MPKQSKHATKLRELNFEPLGEAVDAYIEHRMERRAAQLLGRPLTRKDRRIVKKEKVGTMKFIVFDGPKPSIDLTDELGKSWRRPGTLDELSKLTRLGFKDETLSAAITSVMLPPLPPEKAH